VILTRGYLGERVSRGGVLPPQEEGDEGSVSPSEWGDEVALLRELAPQAWLVVGARRAQNFKNLFLPEFLKRISPQSFEEIRDKIVVILDDGFQHHALRRSLNIIAVTSSSRNERLFRDFNFALKKADLLVWTKGDRCPVEPSDPRLVEVKLQVPRPSNREAGREWWLVTGIGDGDAALLSIKSSGWSVVKHLQFRDHARYHPEVLQAIFEDAQRLGVGILTTGKDWVKWRTLGIKPDVNLRVLEPKLHFLQGRDRWVHKLWGASSL
jgi:tetraacyldisaccharide-1-P 4'-kinase